ncbi:MAG: hypothetical protein ACOH1J_03160, partial [Microbacteriaceae bacterium]
ARFPDTEEVAGSIPVSLTQRQGPDEFGALLFNRYRAGDRRSPQSQARLFMGERPDSIPGSLTNEKHPETLGVLFFLPPRHGKVCSRAPNVAMMGS